MKLPSQSCESTKECKGSTVRASESESESSKSPSRESSSLDQGTVDNPYPSASSLSTKGGLTLRTPMSNSQVLTSHKRSESTFTEQQDVGRMAMSPTKGAMSPERPNSPTKGLGGFVQSAMMKRSDSVNKRASTHLGPGLKRGDSIASNRGGLGNPTPVSAFGQPGSPPRELKTLVSCQPASPLTTSRPSSSGTTSTLVQNPSTTEPTRTFEIPSQDETLRKIEEPLKEDDPQPNSAFQLPRLRVGDDGATSGDSLLASPTKTTDPKRWSPTKASWLESALIRPESPKVASPKPQPPTWLSELNNSKQSRGDPNSARGQKSRIDVVKSDGLMRSPPSINLGKPLTISRGAESLGVRKRDPVDELTLSLVDDLRPDNPPLLAERSREDSPSKAISVKEFLRGNDKEITSGESGLQSRSNPLSATVTLSTPPMVKKETPVPEAKPRTPPKTDFRATLKPRLKVSEVAAPEELEFKNVFGKLRRTQTKSYVAPDELKDNILRGKTSLSLTAGPQKNTMVDDFVDSLVKQRDAMKVLTEAPPMRSSESRLTAKRQPEIPEALAKRNILNRPDSSFNNDASEKSVLSRPLGSLLKEPAIPQAPSNQKSKQPLGSKGSASQPATVEERSSDDTVEAPCTNQAGFWPASASGAAGCSPPARPNERSADIAKWPVNQKNDSGTSTKLVSRLNPGLADILSRGPISSLGSRNRSTDDLPSSIQIPSTVNGEDSTETSGGHLNHMTKGRAKGPKRRLPKVDEVEAAATIDESDPSMSTKIARPGVRSPRNIAPAQTFATLVNGNEKSVTGNHDQTLSEETLTRVSDPQASVEHIVSGVQAEDNTARTKPAVAVKSPELSKVSSPPSKAGAFESSVAAPKIVTRQAQDTSMFKPAFHEGDALAIKDVKRSTIAKANDEPSRRAVIASTPLSQESQDPIHQSSQLSTKALNGLGLTLDSAKLTNRVPYPELTPPPDINIANPARREERPAPGAKSVEPLIKRSKPFAQADRPHAAKVLATFFDKQPRAIDRAEFDAQLVLSPSSEGRAKVKLVKMQIWEINGDGKKRGLPPQQEHILFEECMYLCVHNFQDTKGGRSAEAYLWYGCRVGEAALDDALLFCRKTARENNAKLEVLKQGRESVNFFQALGGILIVRRSKSSALYMLCGRKHLGHVAFDEVDLDLDTLCSGFPYLISAKFGKLYLWKGEGSGAEELGCARLIGMDSGLTGEIEEIDEGKEPASFLESFSSSSAKVRRKHSDYWTSKSSHDQYGCRLFRVEHEQPKLTASFWGRRGSSPTKAAKTASIQEIWPFSQEDLEAGSIFVLDAYFEIYV